MAVLQLSCESLVTSSSLGGPSAHEAHRSVSCRARRAALSRQGGRAAGDPRGHWAGAPGVEATGVGGTLHRSARAVTNSSEAARDADAFRWIRWVQRLRARRADDADRRLRRGCRSVRDTEAGRRGAPARRADSNADASADSNADASADSNADASADSNADASSDCIAESHADSSADGDPGTDSCLRRGTHRPDRARDGHQHR